MIALAQHNIVPIVIALLVGLVIGWWMFRARRRRPLGTAEPRGLEEERPAPPVQPRQTSPQATAPPREGRGIHDHGAAAAIDVAGEIFGVDAHRELGRASGPPDNLQILKGVGPKMATLLNQQGITRFAQLARLNAADVERIDAAMGAFRGRLARDRIVEQAAFLARGDRDGFEAHFGKLGAS
jgi:predicted flap endonuclease-1-like 5' DNA nuclease